MRYTCDKNAFHYMYAKRNQTVMPTVQINATQPVYDEPEGQVICDAAGHEVYLPQTTHCQTYTVSSVQIVNNRTWVGLFINDYDAPAWVPLDQVHPLSAIPVNINTNVPLSA